jgi:G:T-mismatch repair DNA endonuclease (very short patch repair protein)
MRGRTKTICNYCNKTFSHVLSKNSKYCSKECKNNAQRTSVKYNCFICGKEYEVFEKYNNGNGSIFCSQKCRSSQKTENRCKNCGKVFKVKPSQSFQKFCNKGCKKLYNKNLYKRRCEFCGEEFYINFPSSPNKYCSRECLNKSSKIILKCGYCGKDFSIIPSKKQTYCSLKCSNSAEHKVKILIKNTIDRISKGECVSKTELLLKEDLENNGFVSQYISEFGSIDFVNIENKIAVFVDGVFWHGKDSCHWKTTSFKDKIIKTKYKDAWQNENMPKKGWVVLRYWDDYVRKYTDECIYDILSYIK